MRTTSPQPSTPSIAEPIGEVERSAIRKVIVRLVPFVALMFFINYLDRTAIGFAGPNGMEGSLALSAAQFGFASGVFFIGYIVLEVPSNLALHKFGARRWLARIMVTWGVVAVLFTFVQNFTQLAVLRFLLGTLAFFLPSIIAGFQTQSGATFSLVEKGLITAIPYLPAAVALFLLTRHATRHGVTTGHIAIPAVLGAVSTPLALYAGSPALTVAVITVTACSIFAALPNFWTVPTQFLTGLAAAAGIALINTMGNVAGFAAPYVTGFLKDATGDYKVSMFVVGALMLLSAVLMVLLGRSSKVSPDARVDVPAGH